MDSMASGRRPGISTKQIATSEALQGLMAGGQTAPIPQRLTAAVLGARPLRDGRLSPG